MFANNSTEITSIQLFLTSLSQSMFRSVNTALLLNDMLSCTCFRCCVEGQSIIFCCTNAGHFMCYIPNHNKWYNLRPPLICKPDPKVGVKSTFGISLKYHKICSSKKNQNRKNTYVYRVKLSALKCVLHTW